MTTARLKGWTLALTLLAGPTTADPTNRPPTVATNEVDQPDDSNFLGERSNSTAHDEAYRTRTAATADGTFADPSGPAAPATLTRQLRPNASPVRPGARQGDDEGPVISHRPPAEAYAGAPLALSASVTDPSGLESVHLHYRLTASAPYVMVPMKLAADGQYRARLAALPLGTTTVDYQIVATDLHANQRSVGTAADPIQMPVRAESAEPSEAAPAATGSQVALALPIVLVLGLLYRWTNRQPAPTGSRRALAMSRPTATAERPPRSREGAKSKEIDRTFWRRLLTPLGGLSEGDCRAALTELSSRPLRHPVYGARQFPAGYLRFKLAELVIAQPAAAPSGDRPAPTRTAGPPHEHELELDLGVESSELDLNLDWLHQVGDEVGDPTGLAPTSVIYAEPSCLLNAAVVSADPEELRRIKLMLEEFDLFVETASTATEALDLVYRAPYRLLVVRYPLRDIEVDSFLQAVRQPNSPCLRSSVILLADGNDRKDAERCIGRGANHILALTAPQAELHAVASGLLNIADRKRVRLLARVEPMAGAKDLILCQTDNVSSTGMLIHTDRRYPLGTACRFEFQLPDEEAPLHGIAEVVRHTAGDRERTGGIGFRFVSFAGDSRTRFETALLRL